RPGAAALGRTVGLVEPVSAEYRLLGLNQAFLATLRSATGGVEAGLPSDPWRHDLRSTASFAELWPWLLILAVLLWPLDIALRRVSLGRRELAEARAWVGRTWRRRRAAAPRSAAAEGLLASRDRVVGATARAALLRGDQPSQPAVVEPARATSVDREAPEAAPAEAAPPETALGAPAADLPGAPGDTIARLREAKRRARGG
ncbi:MAG TPA: hypothetical protein VNH13_10235, partial [Candidatus Acidoferrales bacterium]|nr:hypothetical protein [Candidatus Acidoferrales bacterium]